MLDGRHDAHFAELFARSRATIGPGPLRRALRCLMRGWR